MSGDEELAELGSPDVWAAHLPGRELVPRYLVSRFAAQYRVVVEVLLEAQDTSLTRGRVRRARRPGPGVPRGPAGTTSQAALMADVRLGT